MKLLVFFLLFGFYSIGNAQSNNFNITGQVIGRDTGFVSLSFVDGNDHLVNDTVQLKNGIFSFSGFIKEPTRAILRGKIKSFAVDDPNSTEVFIEPSEMKITLIDNDFKSIKVKGSYTQKQLDTLNKQKKPIFLMSKSLVLQISKISDELSVNKDTILEHSLLEKRAQLIQKAKPYNEQLKKIDLAFISSHPTSYLSPYLLNSYVGRVSDDSIKMYFSKFDISLQNIGVGKYIQQKLNKVEKAIGDNAPNFKEKDFHQKDFELSSLKGKYVLLDFWASWCLPCRKLTPVLKALYNKYHSKGFEIVAISILDDKDNWTKAIKEEGTMSWYHIFQDLKNDIINQFGYESIPAEFLIDTNGIIIGKYLGSDQQYTGIEELENKLKEIFGDGD